MSKLTVSPYTKQSVAQASGMRVTFDVTPPAEGVVYQNVHMIYHVGGDERTFRYAEAWRMTAAGKNGKRRRTPALDQGGDDSFLVPDEAWADAPPVMAEPAPADAAAPDEPAAPAPATKKSGKAKRVTRSSSSGA